ncbi:immunity 22 family protein [Lacrimispora sp. JR3]
MGSEFGIDFGINTYDEDYLVTIVNNRMSNNINDIFSDAMVFDIELLKQDYINGLEGEYNVAIVIGKLKYEGEVKEIKNDQFGYFKFLGAYPED